MPDAPADIAADAPPDAAADRAPDLGAEKAPGGYGASGVMPGILLNRFAS